jgi:Protein of unknown function (DUF2530)
VKPPRRPAPPPLEANDRQVTVIGTAVWAGALVILLILRDQLAADQRWWIWTCVAGVCMGLFALWYVPRFKRARARKAQQRAAAQAAQATGTAQAGAAGQAAGTEPPAEDPAIAPADAGTGGAVDGGTGGPVDGQPWSSDSKTVSSTETPG